MSKPSALCPLRPGEPCSLCQLYVTGPQDCGLVQIVMTDPELRELWVENRRRLLSNKTKRPAKTHKKVTSKPEKPTVDEKPGHDTLTEHTYAGGFLTPGPRDIEDS